MAAEHYPVKAGFLGGRYVIAKLGKQRKAREYLVQGCSDESIIVSEGYGSKGTIGRFELAAANVKDGTINGKITFEGAHFPHLALAKPFAFPVEFVKTCIEVCQPEGATTTQAGITVNHTVRVIG